MCSLRGWWWWKYCHVWDVGFWLLEQTCQIWIVVHCASGKTCITQQLDWFIYFRIIIFHLEWRKLQTSFLNTVTLEFSLLVNSAVLEGNGCWFFYFLFFSFSFPQLLLCKGFSDCDFFFPQWGPATGLTQTVWTFHWVLQGLNCGTPCIKAWKTSGNPRTKYSLL